ncbi:MAG: FAD binding domain-containing protein [Candidatus Riflebacteria bacterium]|nr:FAD binding domain-containing protein [Candidatus Riflebacteria bacterium]
MTASRYERPATVAQAAALLSEAPGRATVLAGGTDLSIRLRTGLFKPELLVDIKHIPSLSEIRWTSSGDLVIGAAVTMRRLYSDQKVCAAFPALTQGARSVGSLQIQERATVGGNVCNASPCMDSAPPLIVMDARLVAVGVKGEREIPIREFFKHVKKTVLAENEVVTAIIVPAAAAGLLTAFDKLKRVRGHDLALVNAAAAYDPGARTLVGAVGSCGVTPVMTRVLTGVDASAAEEVGPELARAALEKICPIDDVRASAEYRRDMTALLCRRLVAKLLSGTAGR